MCLPAWLLPLGVRDSPNLCTGIAYVRLLNPLIEPTRGAKQRLRWRGGGVGRGRAAALIASAWVRAKVSKSE
eukprot:6211908-Pleurochrysis_carterae.AAC.2